MKQSSCWRWRAGRLLGEAGGCAGAVQRGGDVQGTVGPERRCKGTGAGAKVCCLQWEAGGGRTRAGNRYKQLPRAAGLGDGRGARQVRMGAAAAGGQREALDGT